MSLLTMPCFRSAWPALAWRAKSPRAERPIGLVPLDGVTQAVLEGGPGRKTEALAGAAGVQRSARLAVRLGRVPAQLALKSGQPGDKPDQVLDRDLGTHAEIYGVCVVVAFGRQNDALSGVVHIQELA